MMLVSIVIIVILVAVILVYLISSARSNNFTLLQQDLSTISRYTSNLRSFIAASNVSLLGSPLLSSYNSSSPSNQIMQLAFDPTNAINSQYLSHFGKSISSNNVEVSQILGYKDEKLSRQIVNATYSLGFPINTTPLYNRTVFLSLYDLEGIGSNIGAIAEALGQSYRCINNRTNSTTASQQLGYAEPIIPASYSYFFGSSQTMVTNNFNYTLGDASAVALVPMDWFALYPKSSHTSYASLLNGSTLSCSNYSINLGQFLYAISFYQYSSYAFSEILYNRSADSNIFLASYSYNITLINLGNLNPASSVSMSVDNSTVNYTRYFNFLVSKRHLDNGIHKIRVLIDNRAFIQNLSIVPNPA